MRNFDQRLETIARRVRETFPGGCQIFIANIYDPSDGAMGTSRTRAAAWPDGLQVLAAYNQVLAKLAERNPMCILLTCTRCSWDMESIAAVLASALQTSDPHYWYWDNLEDPNDRGYDAAAAADAGRDGQIAAAAVENTMSEVR